MISAKPDTVQNILGSQKWQLGEERDFISDPSVGFTSREDRHFPQHTGNQPASALSLGSLGKGGEDQAVCFIDFWL